MDTEVLNTVMKNVHDAAVIEGKYAALSDMFKILNKQLATSADKSKEFIIADFLTKYMERLDMEARL